MWQKGKITEFERLTWKITCAIIFKFVFIHAKNNKSISNCCFSNTPPRSLADLRIISISNLHRTAQHEALQHICMYYVQNLSFFNHPFSVENNPRTYVNYRRLTPLSLLSNSGKLSPSELEWCHPELVSLVNSPKTRQNKQDNCQATLTLNH